MSIVKENKSNIEENEIIEEKIDGSEIKFIKNL